MDNNKVLKFIIKNKKVTLPQIQKEFSIKYSEALEVLNSLIKSKFVVYDNDNFYMYNKSKDDSNDGNNKDNKIEIEINNEYDNGYNYNSNNDSLPVALEKMRRNLLERLNVLNNNDDEDGCENDDNDDRHAHLNKLMKELRENMPDEEDDENINADDEIINGEAFNLQIFDDNAINVEYIDLKRIAALCRIKNGMKIVQNAEDLKIKSYSGDVLFDIVNDNGIVLLTDNGETMQRLKNKIPNALSNSKKTVESILSEYKIQIENDIIMVELDINNAFECYCNFCAAIARIDNLDIGKIEEAEEMRKLEDFRFNVMQQLIEDNPQIKRTEAILLMQDKYIKVKDSRDYDEIIIYAKAIKEFGMLTDAQFEFCRKQIVGE